jgi:hypothetical protein
LWVVFQELFTFLGMFARLWKATISFVMSVCLFVRPSVCMDQLGSHQTDIHWTWYLGIFTKSFKKIKVSLKPYKNNRYFTWRPAYIFDSILLNFSYTGKCFRQKL